MFADMRSRKNILIDAWIRARERDGVKALSDATNIPTSSIMKIRAGRIPQDPLKREALARALGVKESELFPAPTGRSRAS